MHSLYRTTALTACLMMSFAAQAQTVSEADAKKVEGALPPRLLEALQRDKALKVVRLGDGYSVSLDLAQTLAESIAPWQVKSFTPIVHRLKQNSTTKAWEFSSTGALEVVTELLAANRSNGFKLTIGQMADKGTIEPKLGFLREAEISLKDVSASMRSSQNTIKTDVENYTARIDTTILRPGVADVKTTYSGNDLSVVFGSFPNPEVKISAKALEGAQSGDAVDIAGLTKLFGFWGAPGRPTLVSDFKPLERKQYAAIIAAYKPFANNVGEKVALTDIKASSNGRTISAESFGYFWRIEDIGGKGAVVYGAKLVNLAVSKGFWSAGVEKALPQEVNFSVRQTGTNFAGVWDAASKGDYAVEPDFRKIMLPDDRLVLEFSDTYARSQYYDLTLTGTLLVHEGTRDRYSGDVTVTAKDFDKTVKFLQDNSKTLPVLSQASFVALVAKGLGKPQADGSLSWNIKFNPPGKTIVNDHPLPF